MAALIAGVKDTIEPWSDPAHVETRARARAEASNPHPSVPHFSWRYKIEPETGSDGNPTRNLKTTRFADDTGALPAWPDIAGCSPPAGSDTTGIYTLSNEEPARWELAWKGLYLMTHQSARVSAWIERNDDLSEDPDLVTNPAFIYKTPIVTFASPLVPLVDYEQTLTPPPEHSFHAALSHVFDAFRHTDLQDRAASELKFALEASYGHVVAERGGGNTLTAQAPIFLVHGDLATQPNGAGPARQTVAEFVHSAAGRLAAWHDAEHPNPKGAFASLRFTAFATVARGERPLAIFREIQLPVGASAEWWAAPS